MIANIQLTVAQEPLGAITLILSVTQRDPANNPVFKLSLKLMARAEQKGWQLSRGTTQGWPHQDRTV